MKYRIDTTLIAIEQVGLLFTAGVVPLTMFFSRDPAVPMIMSIYITLGIFLLLAVRNLAANRSLIAFAGWANLAHAAVMAAQESQSTNGGNP
jgi:succinate-acetate transporter protein